MAPIYGLLLNMSIVHKFRQYVCQILMSERIKIARLTIGDGLCTSTYVVTGTCMYIPRCIRWPKRPPLDVCPWYFHLAVGRPWIQTDVWTRATCWNQQVASTASHSPRSQIVYTNHVVSDRSIDCLLICLSVCWLGFESNFMLSVDIVCVLRVSRYERLCSCSCFL